MCIELVIETLDRCNFRPLRRRTAFWRPTTTAD
jgi:hypothetical protein